MRMLPRDWTTTGLSALAVAGGVLFGFQGWLQPNRPVEFCSLIMAATIVAAASRRHPAAARRGAMAPSFVIEFLTLSFSGVWGATFVASVARAMTGRVADPERPAALREMATQLVAAAASMAAAGFAYGALGGATSGFVWPRQALPIVGAVTAYLAVQAVLIHVIAPFVMRRPIARDGLSHLVREAPAYFVGAAVAAGLAELLDRRMWEVLPIAAVPVFFLYRAYASHFARLEEDHHRLEVIDELRHGMSVVDAHGRVTLWNDPLERLVGCPRDRAAGHPLAAALPSLRDSNLTRAVTETLTDRTARVVPSVLVPCNGATRVLDVKVLPVSEGAALLWFDVTDRTAAEQGLKKTVDRLTRAADGAIDGLWDGDFRTQDLYVSVRWKAMLGLCEPAEIARVGHWFDRVHPDDAAALTAAVNAHLAGQSERLQHEHRIRHEDGTYRWFLCSGIKGPGRRPSRIAGSLSDITERVAAQERLRSAAFLDPLTGLRNRTDFVEVLGRRLAEFKKQPLGHRFAVLYLDLDRFKVVNDSLGHHVGDELLVAVSRRLESCLREQDCLGRLGGDEFAILLQNVNDELQANAVAFRIQDALKTPLSIGGREVFTSASIGIAVGRAEYETADDLVRDADSAMYHAKSSGKARHELFDADMYARARDRMSLEVDLRRAIERNDFEVHYQPIVVLASGRCIGFESLIRWTRNGEKISPATFIPMAEELGLIDRIGTWVLQQACATFADWQRRYPEAGLNCITVNASSRQLTQQNFPYLVEQAIQASGLKPQDLRIEVTETALMDAPQLAAQVLAQLRDFGVKVYLDDFGTGCSSLSHLHKLPVDALKVDRSFVMSLLNPDRPAIVESILALARTLKTSVVAEGIEDPMQARELERLGCTHAQGFLFSRPLSAEAAEALIIANEPLGPKRTEKLADDLYYASKQFEWPEQTRVAH